MEYKLIEKDRLVIPFVGDIKPFEIQNTWKFEHILTGSEEKVWQLSQEYYYLAVVLPIMYVLAVFTGQKWMSTRPKGYKLQGPLVIWNTLLAVFSIMGTIRCFQEVYGGYQAYGLRHVLCNPSEFYGVPGFWSLAFGLSKIFEFGDTVFVILRKQPLIFLHWFHHATVMFMTWISYIDHCAMGRAFVVVNFAVHSVMYSYYALRACRVPIPNVVSMAITSLQILQMVFFTLLFWYILVDKFVLNGGYCHNSDAVIIICNLVIVIYLVLFVNFFVNAYLKGHKKSASSRKDQ